MLFYTAALKWRQIYLQRRPRGRTVSTTMRTYPLGDSHPPRTLCDPSPSTPSWESPGKERGEGPLALDNETVTLPCVFSLCLGELVTTITFLTATVWRASSEGIQTWFQIPLKSLVGLVLLRWGLSRYSAGLGLNSKEVVLLEFLLQGNWFQIWGKDAFHCTRINRCLQALTYPCE